MRPLQHWLFPVQLPPVGRHVVGAAQKPLALHVRPAQHPPEVEHSCPAEPHVGAEVQKPPLHDNPAQHGEAAEQVWLEARHVVPPPLWHRPVAPHVSPLQHARPETPVQSSPLPAQVPPPVPVHTPPEQTPEQHSEPLVQEYPGSEQYRLTSTHTPFSQVKSKPQS